MNRTVSIIALPDIHQTGQTANGAKVKVIEAVFATGKCIYLVNKLRYVDTTKLEKFFKLSAFQITFLQLNTKKILLYVIGQDFLNYYFLQLEFSIARSTWERYHITNIGHTGNKQQQPWC